MAKISKTEILGMLSKNLEVFFPKLRDCFMCPTCLTAIPLHKKERITEAHVIPRAARGKLKTFLCKKCNSHFGTKQDKWFGEHLKLINKEIPTLLATDIKDGRFWLDDIQINGTWKIGQNKELIFYVLENLNPPWKNEYIKKKYKKHPPKVSLKVSIPILKQKRMIDMGFLTAAYLMWFGALGYSWVLQDHLNLVREQILNPEKNILKNNFIARCEGIRWKEPWYGLVTIAGEIVLAMGLEDCLIIFPPADRPEIYSKLGNDFSGYIGTDIRQIELRPRPYYGPPVWVMFDNRLMVVPNAFIDFSSLTVILFTSVSTKAEILRGSISKEMATQLKKLPNVVTIRPEFSPKLKKWDIKDSE